MVPNADWFLYGFVRKEAVVTSQIEGTQATLKDVLTYEATHKAERPEDVEEVCNYVDAAVTYARREIASRAGLPLTIRLLREAHRRLMHGVRGAEKQPGEIRTSQTWIGGRFAPSGLPCSCQAKLSARGSRCIVRPGAAGFHTDDPLPPLVRAGLAHVQFETIHPFLDGNGRIGRLLVALLVEHWGFLPLPLLYLSLAFRRRQEDYVTVACRPFAPTATGKALDRIFS